MNNLFSNPGKWLILIGLFFILAGIGLSLLQKIPYLGRLPGDIYIKKGNFIFYMPLTTSIIISIILSLLLIFFSRR